MAHNFLSRHACDRCGFQAELPGKVRHLPDGWFSVSVRPGAATKRNPSTNLLPNLEKSVVVCALCAVDLKRWWDRPSITGEPSHG